MTHNRVTLAAIALTLMTAARDARRLRAARRAAPRPGVLPGAGARGHGLGARQRPELRMGAPRRRGTVVRAGGRSTAEASPETNVRAGGRSTAEASPTTK